MFCMIFLALTNCCVIKEYADNLWITSFPYCHFTDYTKTLQYFINAKNKEVGFFNDFFPLSVLSFTFNKKIMQKKNTASTLYTTKLN